jgi:hypothetical protein
MSWLLRAAPFVAGLACAAIAARADEMMKDAPGLSVSIRNVCANAAGNLMSGADCQVRAGMKVTIEVIPHEAQRYDTVGDWHFTEAGDLEIKVSKMSDPRYEMLIAGHEIDEALMCRRDGVWESAVDDWDKGYAARYWEKGHASPYAEPGDNPAAPYHKQHVAATRIERVRAKAYGVDWRAYNREVKSK